PETGALEYQQATEHFVGDYDGPMYRLRSEQVDLLVTPQHRMWVRARDTQAARRGDPQFHIRHAEELIGRRVAYRKTAAWHGQEDGVVELPGTKRVSARADSDSAVVRHYVGNAFPLIEFARVLGHWLAEGSLGGQQIVVAQRRGPERDGMAANIDATGSPTHQPTIGHGPARTQGVALRAQPETGDHRAHEQRIPDYVHQWGPRALRAFLEAYADGSESCRSDGDRDVIQAASRRLADELQILAIKAGWSADVRVDEWSGLERVLPSGQRFKSLRPSYLVSLVKTHTDPLVNDGGARHDSWQPYRGKVYCVKVPNGLLFVRRNGKPVVSGNTHELIRHRAGSAFSQESLRYVRLTDISFRVPPALEPLRDQVISLVEQLEEFQVSAAEQLGIENGEMPFHVKKEITSALRRLAPIGLSTDILWTANVRTLRHVIEMRTAEGAEEELRTVFNLVAELMKREAPSLFQDFSRRDDGSWVPEWHKV
ncbi:MAG: FAD-dependent thymidylate synthase, partial [Acidobacteriota bacterium]|nr:FAD-dependent thymidylate synthase [Acidobacteriota bacterium]